MCPPPPVPLTPFKVDSVRIVVILFQNCAKQHTVLQFSYGIVKNLPSYTRAQCEYREIRRQCGKHACYARFATALRSFPRSASCCLASSVFPLSGGYVVHTHTSFRCQEKKERRYIPILVSTKTDIPSPPFFFVSEERSSISFHLLSMTHQRTQPPFRQVTQHTPRIRIIKFIGEYCHHVITLSAGVSFQVFLDP